MAEIRIVDEEALASVVKEIDGRYGLLGGIKQLKQLLERMEMEGEMPPEEAARMSILTAAKALQGMIDNLSDLMERLEEVAERFRERLMVAYEIISIGAPLSLKLMVERLPTMQDRSLVAASKLLLEKLETIILALNEAESDVKEIKLEAWEVISKKIHERNKRILDKLYRAGDSGGDRGSVSTRSDGSPRRSGVIDFRRFVDYKQARAASAPHPKRGPDEAAGSDRGDAGSGPADQDHHPEGEAGRDIDLDSGVDLHTHPLPEQHDGNGDS